MVIYIIPFAAAVGFFTQFRFKWPNKCHVACELKSSQPSQHAQTKRNQPVPAPKQTKPSQTSHVEMIYLMTHK